MELTYKHTHLFQCLIGQGKIYLTKINFNFNEFQSLSHRFKTFAKLDKKSDENLSDYYKVFIAMCKRQAGEKLLEEEKGLDNIIDEIGEDHAKLILDRLELLSKLREIVKHSKFEERLKLCENNLDTPDWWESGKHDRELVRAVLKYGLYRSDQYILNDAEFPFMNAEKRYVKNLEVLKSFKFDNPAELFKLAMGEMPTPTKSTEKPKEAKIIPETPEKEPEVIEKPVEEEKIEEKEAEKSEEEIKAPKSPEKAPEELKIDEKPENEPEKEEIEIAVDEAVKEDEEKPIVEEEKEVEKMELDDEPAKEKPVEDKEKLEEEHEEEKEKSIDEKMEVDEPKIPEPVSEEKEEITKIEEDKPEPLVEESKVEDTPKSPEAEVEKIPEVVEEEKKEEVVEVKNEPIERPEGEPKIIDTVVIDDDDTSPEKPVDQPETSKQAADLKARFPDLEIFQPLMKLKQFDAMLKGDVKDNLKALSRVFDTSMIVKWFREFALEKRISHIIYCVEKGVWPVGKSYSAYSGCLGIDLDLPLYETVKRLNADKRSSSSTPDIITITTDHQHGKSSLASQMQAQLQSLSELSKGKKGQKRHIAIDVETERAKLHALLNNTGQLSASQKAQWNDDETEVRRSSSSSSLQQPPPAHQHVSRSSMNTQYKPTVTIPGTSSTLTPIDLSSR